MGEIQKGEIIDHSFPGSDIEAVTIDPDAPNLLFLGLEGPNRIVAVNLETMTTYQPLYVEDLVGKNHKLEALAVCPENLCGLPKALGRRLIAGGSSSSLRVIDIGAYPTVRAGSSPRIVDTIDLDALLCLRIGR